MWWLIESCQASIVSSRPRTVKYKPKKRKISASTVSIMLARELPSCKIHLFQSLAVTTILNRVTMEEVKALVQDSRHPSITTLKESLVSIRWMNCLRIRLFPLKLPSFSIPVALLCLLCKLKVHSIAQDKLLTIIPVCVLQVKWEVRVICIRILQAAAQTTLRSRADLQTITLRWVRAEGWVTLQTILHRRWTRTGHNLKTSKMTKMRKIDYAYLILLLKNKT